MQQQLGSLRLVSSALGFLFCFFAALAGPAVALAAPGSLDPTFGSGGTVITSFGGSDVASAVVVQSDGKLVRVEVDMNALRRRSPRPGAAAPGRTPPAT